MQQHHQRLRFPSSGHRRRRHNYYCINNTGSTTCLRARDLAQRARLVVMYLAETTKIMLTRNYDHIWMLRKPGDPKCICKRGDFCSGWSGDWDGDRSWKRFIRYRKASSDGEEDVLVEGDDPAGEEEEEEGGDVIITLAADEFHPKLNPEEGVCACCDCVVFRLTRYNCDSCGILLCRDCMVTDRYQDHDPVCYLCRVHHTEKNADAYY